VPSVSSESKKRSPAEKWMLLSDSRQGKIQALTLCSLMNVDEMLVMRDSPCTAYFPDHERTSTGNYAVRPSRLPRLLLQAHCAAAGVGLGFHFTLVIALIKPYQPTSLI
jgi:hypothetical protein